MKTNEFINKVQELGYQVFGGFDDLRVCNDKILARVSINEFNKLDTLWEEDVPSELFGVLVSYATTPVKEREDEIKKDKFRDVVKLLEKENVE